LVEDTTTAASILLTNSS